MENDFEDMFDDDGELEMPTMRGSANLDPQDYARDQAGDDSSILDDDLQEDIPSRPGAGAGPAFDIDGTSNLEFSPDDDGPGMNQTTYGAHPWGAGSGQGYRPASMQRTDMNLGSDDADDTRKPRPMRPDSMHMEPEVVQAEAMLPVEPPRWTGNRNQMPSNDDVYPETLYDRESYEFDDSSQNVIGSGVFDMEEGVTWRPRDGIFANQYAMPAYLADEDELGVQQSEMWDTTANNWRTTQVSAAGVPLKRRVASLRPVPAYSPFTGRGPLPEMRPESTGPRSHVEAFGRKAASLVVKEAAMMPPQARSAFLSNAIETLGPGMAARANEIAAKLVSMGYPSQNALEDVVAHCVMHAAVKDLMAGRGRLQRLDRLADTVRATKGEMRAAAGKHIAPLARSKQALKNDLGSLYRSPAAAGMGQIEETAPPSASAVPSNLFSARNLIIAGVVAGAGYYAWTNRKKITRNAKKLAKRVGL